MKLWQSFRFAPTRPMKLWLVWEGYWPEERGLEGIFKTKVEAEEYARILLKKYDESQFKDVDIEERQTGVPKE